MANTHGHWPTENNVPAPIEIMENKSCVNSLVIISSLDIHSKQLQVHYVAVELGYQR